jgi:hypothetical protein
MDDADFSYQGYTDNIRRIMRTRIHTTRWALVFILLWPIGMMTLACMGAVGWLTGLQGFLAPVVYSFFMWSSGTANLNNWWTFVKGTLVFTRGLPAPAEPAEAWVNEHYGPDRVWKFSDRAFLFRHKRDATLFKMTWG